MARPRRYQEPRDERITESHGVGWTFDSYGEWDGRERKETKESWKAPAVFTAHR